MKLYFPAIFFVFLFSVHCLFAQETKSIYSTETLQIEQISPNTFVHISYLNTQDFGKVACNGMIVINGGEALILDTLTDDETSWELISWLEKEQHVKVKAVLATHFHNDCVGGLKAFHAKGVASYGSNETITLAKAAGDPVPENGFYEELILEVGDLEVINMFFGQGHTRDNVVAYVPSDQVLFGGCLIKELGAGLGFLGDANTATWSETVSKVKSNFPQIRIVIPGHGKIGGEDLLDFTIRMFEGKVDGLD